MFEWKNASTFQLNRLEAIKILFGNNTDLLKFLLHPEMPKLTASVELIKEDMKCFDEERQVLLLLGLCLWGESVTELGIGDVFDKLSGEAFKGYIKALLFTVQNPCTEKAKVTTLDDIINDICGIKEARHA